MRLRRRQWLPVGPVLRMHTVHKYVIRHECVLDCKKCSAVVKKVKANILWWALPGYVNKAVNICCRCDSLCLFLSEAFTPRCCRLSHIKAEVNKIACYPVSDWGHTGPKEKLPQIRVKVNIDTCKGLKRKPPPITEGGIFLEGFMSRFFYISILYFSKFQLLWESCTECVWRVGGGGAGLLPLPVAPAGCGSGPASPQVIKEREVCQSVLRTFRWTSWLCVEVLFNEILTAHRGHGFFDLASWKCERCREAREDGEGAETALKVWGWRDLLAWCLCALRTLRMLFSE